LEVNEMPSLDADGFPAFEQVVGRCLRDVVRVMLNEPSSDPDAFFSLLIDEVPLLPVPSTVNDLILNGCGYCNLPVLSRVTSDPALFRDNKSVESYLEKIAMRKRKEKVKEDKKKRQAAVASKIVLDQIRSTRSNSLAGSLPLGRPRSGNPSARPNNSASELFPAVGSDANA